MATNHITIKRHERSDKQKYMEHKRLGPIGGPESKMKFSSRLVESPPPKPPRRRYSEQLSPPHSGNHSSYKKCNEETHKGDLKLKQFNTKPAYLSLPASLTASVSNDDDDTINIQSHTSDFSDHVKTSKEKEFYMKYFLESLKLSDIKKKAFHCNLFCNKEKIQSVNQDIISDRFSKNQCDSFVPFILEKHFRNSYYNESFIPSYGAIHIKKSVRKHCRRRHSDPTVYHSAHYMDPVLLCPNILKESSLKYDCGSVSHSTRKNNRYCDCTGSCSCCKKNYLIMQEIGSLKEINEKLWQHLCSLQICLENKKKKSYNESADISISELLSSIYYAQKAKDDAMEERLKIVLEERDTAFNEIDDLIHAFSRSYDYSDSEKELHEDKKDLLGEVDCTVNLPRLLRYQRILLTQFNNLKDSKQDSLSHQLRQVINERNSALEKVKKLEDDVKNLKISFDLWHSDNKHWEITMFDVLNQTIRQRDCILSKIDNSLDFGSVKYRLDSIEHNQSSFEPRSKTVESLKTNQTLNFSDYKQHHSLKTSDEIRMLKEEIVLLKKALDGEKKRRERSEKKCVRLERLIHILRKKLNGQDIGVPV